MNTKHTPLLEYYLETLPPSPSGISLQFHTIRVKDGDNVARLHDQDLAEFIVRACNSHDELLEALSESPCTCRQHLDWPGVTIECKRCAAIARATL